MKKTNDGGPAFPIPSDRDPYGQGIVQGADGMSLRDYFAGQAVKNATALPYSLDVTDAKQIAIKAYRVADAMLEARKR